MLKKHGFRTTIAYLLQERWTAPQHFSTVVHKYGDRKNKDYGSVVANALINLGYVYTYHYVEYARTYSCLTEAISIGGKTPGNRNPCTTYLNLANIYLI